MTRAETNGGSLPPNLSQGVEHDDNDYENPLKMTLFELVLYQSEYF